jgi:hypothetical protein
MPTTSYPVFETTTQASAMLAGLLPGSHPHRVARLLPLRYTTYTTSRLPPFLQERKGMLPNLFPLPTAWRTFQPCDMAVPTSTPASVPIGGVR